MVEKRENQEKPEKSSKTVQPDSDQLEFQVTETKSEDREFVGGQKGFSSDDKDDLGIKSPGELMDEEARTRRSTVDPSFYQPMYTPDESLATSEPAGSSAADQGGHAKGLTNKGAADKEKDQFHKLTDKEVAAIEKNLYARKPYLTGRERDELMHKLEKVGHHKSSSSGSHQQDTMPPLSPSLDEESGSPRMAQRARGIAYFYKNYIQIVGRHDLSVADELLIGNRPYDLRPKRLNGHIMLGVGIGIFAIALVIIASFFVTDTKGARGEIVGMVFAEKGQPYLQKATLKFPELKVTINSNSQGYFRSGPVAEGTYRIEYYLDGTLAKVEFATVAAGEITMLSLIPDREQMALSRESKAAEKAPKPITSTTPATNRNTTAADSRISTSAKGDKAVPTAKPQQKPNPNEPGKIQLAANIDGARLTVDDNVLGAGNLTYSGITPGKHNYEVSKTGYETIRGTINVQAGEVRTISVELSPATQTAKTKEYDHEDYYYSASGALDAKDAATALKDLNAAIKLKPNYAEAHLLRAKAHLLNGDTTSAFDDFVRAAEIFQSSRDHNQAITAYNKALEIDDKSVPVYLGRAKTFLAMKEERAAIADYETIIRLDRRNYDAYFGLGEARFRQGQYKTACKHFKDARSLDANNPLPYQYMMLCYLALDDIKEVKKSYEKFQERASEQQMTQLRKDSRFTAVLHVVDSNEN